MSHRMRPWKSVAPPGENGRIRRTGFAGHAASCARAMPVTPSAAMACNARRRFIGSLYSRIARASSLHGLIWDMNRALGWLLVAASLITGCASSPRPFNEPLLSIADLTASGERYHGKTVYVEG